MQGGRSRFLTVMVVLGLAFFYIPMILLVIYSFNHSKLVPVWGGWSLRWYGVLFESEDVWNAVWLSLRIAFVNATCATALPGWTCRSPSASRSPSRAASTRR